LLAFRGIGDLACSTRDHNAPAFTQSIIDPIDLKADHCFCFNGYCLRLVGAEDDFAVRKFKVHGKGHGSSSAGMDNAPYPAARQVGFALLWGERLQDGVTPGAPMPRRPIHFPAQECARGGIEG
jgi:hypothetical protein